MATIRFVLSALWLFVLRRPCLPIELNQVANKIRACFGTVGSGREACKALLMYAEEVEADGYQTLASIVRQAAFEAAQHPSSKK